MPLQMIRQDIINMDCDAIVCPTDSFFSGSGGTDLTIHRAAGEGLRRECNSIGGCAVGDAVSTGAYELRSKYIIHTVGPFWQGGENGEEELLCSCYKSCLREAEKLQCESVAFPLISTGTFGFPMDKAFRCAMNVLSDYLLTSDMTVYLLVYNKEALRISQKLVAHIASYINDDYVAQRRSEVMPASRAPISRRPALCKAEKREESQLFCEESRAVESPDKSVFLRVGAPKDELLTKLSLEDALNSIDESFSQMLLRKIDEKGIKDSECYKRANIDRKLFSKIRSDVNYRPKKTTAIAFAIALELPRSEADELLRKAGYALSRSNKFDVIVEYFIDNEIYDIFQINEALFAYDQNLIGA